MTKIMNEKTGRIAVGIHGINASAEAESKAGSSYASTAINHQVMKESSAKRDVPHLGDMPKKKSGGIT